MSRKHAQLGHSRIEYRDSSSFPLAIISFNNPKLCFKKKVMASHTFFLSPGAAAGGKGGRKRYASSE